MNKWIKSILLLEDDSKNAPVAVEGFDDNIEKLTKEFRPKQKVLQINNETITTK